MALRRKGNKPVFIARAAHGKDGRYTTRIGAVWPFNEGEGFVLDLDFIPLRTTTIILVPPKEDDPAEDPPTGEIAERDIPY